MQVRLEGVQRVNFTNKEGETINGNNIFCAFKDKNVEGLRTEKFFLKEGVDLPKDTKLNDIIDLSFNMNGRVEKVLKTN